MDLLDSALLYRQSGLCVLPAYRDEKRPSIKAKWEAYQTRLPTEAELQAWFANPQDALCIVCGATSGNMEMMDFDFAAELFEPWRAKVDAIAPGLVDRLYIESTRGQGRHVVYLCESEICGNLKLAQRKCIVEEGEAVVYHGKEYAVRTDANGDRHVVIVLIETRGEGGLFLSAPTAGYETLQGDLCNLPVLTEAERDVLLTCAAELNEYQPEVVDGPRASPVLFPESVTPCSAGLRPGDDFNERGDMRAVLLNHGWTLAKPGENEYWRRPGKTKGWSATLRGRVFYVFSTNAAPFESEKAYGPFGVYAMLEHSGDFAAAASALRLKGYGSQEPMVTPVDLSHFMTGSVEAAPADLLHPLSLDEISGLYPALRAPVIHGLLREGETMNVISAPKAGKSWLVTDLALAVATGRPWLGMQCEKGDVLILDNELHRETSANRIPKVAAARGIPFDEVKARLFIQNLRGHLKDIFALGQYFRQFKPGRFKIIILDAFYRFLPMRTDENDNGTMASLYNFLDAYADYLKCCFVLIHHTSKGNQSLKDVTDVGAGAGSQSRATDAHLVLRKHEEDDAVVLDAAVRSWPPVAPRCLRWTFPVWTPADDLNPASLRKEGGQKHADAEAEPPKTWGVEEFAAEFVAESPRSEDRIYEDAEQQGISVRRIKRLLALALEEGLIHRWTLEPNRTVAYATIEQTVDAPSDDSKRAAVVALLQLSPDATNRDVADRTGVSTRYVQKIRRELFANKNAS